MDAINETQTIVCTNKFFLAIFRCFIIEDEGEFIYYAGGGGKGKVCFYNAEFPRQTSQMMDWIVRPAGGPEVG